VLEIHQEFSIFGASTQALDIICFDLFEVNIEKIRIYTMY